MHSYPWVLVEAESKDEAVEVAQNWLDGQGGECPYDYGNVATEESHVLRGGTDEFRKAVKVAIENERRALREHWDVAKAFLSSFEEPPSDESKRFKATYKVGYGIGPGELLKAGTEIKDDDLSAGMGYYHTRKLDAIHLHMDGRDQAITNDASLYDARYSDDKCPPIEAGKDCWLVLLDCHS
jgi:hypothetical protein